MSEEKFIIPGYTAEDLVGTNNDEEEDVKEANQELNFVKDDNQYYDTNLETIKNSVEDTESETNSQFNFEGSLSADGSLSAANVKFGFNNYTENGSTSLDINQGGPKFENFEEELFQKIEKARTSGWGTKFKNFASERKTFLAIIAVLLIFVGINYFTANQLENSTFRNTQVEELAISDSAITLPGDGVVEGVNTFGADFKGFIESASTGEGVTHLARRAVDRYLQTSGQTLTAEQKIYAEDYLKDVEGNSALSVGQEVGFEKSNLEIAVNQALSLEEWQINSLKQYTN